MMFGISTTIKAISAVIVVIGILGFIWYFTSIRADLSVARENNKKLQDGIVAQNKVINSMSKDFDEIRKINRQLIKENEERKKDVENLVEKFDKRDFGYVAARKPKLVENLINKASDKTARCFELASGAPLNDFEKKAKTPTEANSECPNLISGTNITIIR
jgi:hypothetical protein